MAPSTFAGVTHRELLEHGSLIHNEALVGAYRRALARSVRPGDTVVNPGCGTGLLSLLALEAGAGKVIATDAGPIIELARETLRINGILDRVELHQIRPTDLQLAEPGDVLVMSRVSGGMLELSLSKVVRDYLERGILKPEARVLPSSIDVLVAPAGVPTESDPVKLWSTQQTGFDFSPFLRSANNTPFALPGSTAWLLGPNQLGITLPSRSSSAVSFSVDLRMDKDAHLTGLLAYLRLNLVEAATSTPSHEKGSKGDRVTIEPMYYPLGSGFLVEAGQCIRAHIQMNPGRGLVTWRVRSVAEDEETLQRSTKAAIDIVGSTFLGEFRDPLTIEREGAEPGS